MMDDKLLYSVPEARRIVSLGNTKFYEEVHRGRIRIVKAGGKSLVPGASLRAYADTLIAEAEAARTAQSA
jgi:hypothetical protein